MIMLYCVYVHAAHRESVMIRPQAIRLLHIRPIQIRLHAHSTIYKFVPMSNIRPIQGVVSLFNTRRQFIINKSTQVHQHIYSHVKAFF